MWYHFEWCTYPPILNVGNTKKEVPVLVEMVAGPYSLRKLDPAASNLEIWLARLLCTYLVP